jgi:hypothetical protein
VPTDVLVQSKPVTANLNLPSWPEVPDGAAPPAGVDGAGVLGGVVLGVVAGVFAPPGSVRVATGPDVGKVTDEIAFPIERKAPITTTARRTSTTRTSVSQNHHLL